nr:unknown [Zea mays]ACF85981.1 unknown [Zea mays]
MWAKESLSEAVADHPEMGGRLRRHADGSWEVKLNDAGVRFTEATAEATLDEFLATAQDKDRAPSWEAALAPWADVNAEDPDVSALVYVQLTRFQGDGGFAVGVSCSLMLSDPLSLARFLASWARTHARMKAQNDAAAHPLMQYASYFRRPDARAARALVKSVPLDAFASADAAETVLFRARPTMLPAGAGAPPAPDHRALAVACVAQARERLGDGKVVPPQFPLVVFDCEGGVSVETCAAAAYGQPPSPSGGGRYKIDVALWEELGLEELVLRDSKPLHVSYSILGAGCDGLAVAMPAGAAGELLVAATVPKPK